jgi:hydrogenase maturation protease
MSERGLLILGLGNALCGDDGIGCAAVEILRDSYRRGPEVEIIDGGTLGLSLLPQLTAARQAILVDAVGADAPPGTALRLQGDEVPPAVEARLSPHQVGVADLLQGAEWLGECPQPLILLGLVPESIELGIGLSPAVQAALPGLVERVALEAVRLGYSLSARIEDDVHDPLEIALDSRDRTLRLFGMQR